MLYITITSVCVAVSLAFVLGLKLLERDLMGCKLETAAHRIRSLQDALHEASKASEVQGYTQGFAILTPSGDEE